MGPSDTSRHGPPDTRLYLHFSGVMLFSLQVQYKHQL
jgi:hypothetical protein